MKRTADIIIQHLNSYHCSIFFSIFIFIFFNGNRKVEEKDNDDEDISIDGCKYKVDIKILKHK